MHLGTHHPTLLTVAAALRRRSRMARILLLGRLLRRVGGRDLALQLGPLTVHPPRALNAARSTVQILGRAAHAVLAFTPSLEFAECSTAWLCAQGQPVPLGRSPALVLLRHGQAAVATLYLGPTQSRLLRTLLQARTDQPNQFLKSLELAWRLKVPATSVRKALGRLAGLLDLVGFRDLLQSGRGGYRLVVDRSAPQAAQGGSHAGV